ncbi:MAG: hypothetical protein JO261_01840 [Alphaproteobacteria bacterium]|nr:hypothetical protein [Alphaproteobacteria bacterium]MBV9692420.1 hypothetical protein [Alphaproteobacteria bacterium]
MSKTKLLLSTAVGLAFVVAGPSAMAVGKKHAPVKGAKSAVGVNFAKAPFKQAKNQPHMLKGGIKEKFLVETWGTTTTALFGGFAVEDAANSINCKKACTVVTNNTAELLSYYSYNQVGVCPLVDGYFTNGSCYFSGALSFPELYSNRTNQTNLAVGSGTHTVQTYLYTFAPAYLGHYQNDYHVYQ